MSSSSDIRFYENSYLNALRKGLVDKSNQESNQNYDQDRDNSISSDDGEIQTRSKTAKKTERRNAKKVAAAAGKKYTTTKHATAQQEEPPSSSPIIEKTLKKLTKRQQVLQRYAHEESVGAASVLASIADAAITRSQSRNQNTVMWTEKDRAAASRDAAIALEVATAAAEAAQGKKKKEQPAPYWTRLHEKSRSTVRFQKEMGRVMECDFY
jgi:Ulp1 family protease